MSRFAEMPDADLVAHVAEKCMGWGMLIHRLADGYPEVLMPGSPPPGFPADEWKPLTDWNHAMMVVDAMRAKGWRKESSDHKAGTPFTANLGMFYFCKLKVAAVGTDYVPGNDYSERRAILESAAMAMDHKPKGATS